MHTVWAWGGNAAGQLGLQTRGGHASDAAGGAPAGAVPAALPPPPPAFVAAPLEVVDSVAAAAVGLPVAVACGEEHSVLLCRDGTLHAVGCNAAGAAALPVVQLAAAEFAAVPLPPGSAVASVCAGARNTAAVTSGGRLLVCGTNQFGEAGTGRSGSTYLLTDIGPSAAWHGMQRSHQASGGGGGEAAAAVVGAACGCGSLYVWTNGAEAFAWGQGGQGELGLGGNSRNVSIPSRMPWAHGATCVAASAGGGRFAALLDSHGRLFTFGAGAPDGTWGADFQLAVAGWRPPTGKGVRSGSGGRGSPKAAPLVTRPLQEQQRPLQQESPGSPAAAAAAAAAGTTPAEGGDDAPAGGFKYAQVEPSSPRSPRQHASLAPGSSPSTPRSGRQRSASSNGASTSNGGGGGSGGPRLRGRSGREQRWLEEAEEEWAGGRRRGRGERRRDRLRQPPDATPEATLTRRQRWMQEPPTRACLTTPPDSDGEEEEQGGGGGGGRHDWRVAYLIRRQLKDFCNDPRQRQVAFPRSFSKRDRYKLHVMAEAWGLMHESVGEADRRRLVVWKPSRGRRSLKPSMLEGLSSSDEGGEGGGEEAGGDDSAGGSSGHAGAAAAAATSVVRRIQFTALWFVSQLSEGLLPEVELVSRQASNRTLEAAGGGDADDDGGGDGEDGGGGPFVLRLQAATQRRSLLGRHPESAEAVARLWVLLEAVQGLVLAGETETQRGLWYRFKTLEIFRAPRDVNEAIQDAVNLLEVPRDALGITASSKGLVGGRLIIHDQRTGAETDCAASACGVQIPGDVGKVARDWAFQSDAAVIVVLEKDTIFQRLVSQRFFDRLPCIIVTGKGVPDLATRAFLARLSAAFPALPLVGLVDWNPSGASILSIYRWGSHRMGLESPHYALPCLGWLGARSEQLRAAGAGMFQELTPRDRAVAANLIATLMPAAPAWAAELQHMLDSGAKAEVEALDSSGEGLADMLERCLLDGDSV
ncbi:Meiotic recombination SPO11-2 [Micractinium conductrix]|uniref:DNA topoisomerase (ATP-hydrolyzing) n=1 Tax=Micractinium conductrix TaxID=554055 RepID=A0A2P6VBK4_9CHLO|nr:Meiotic recombination SPO11-2 [Micractinium conductrix]|eukprot:PSC71441.1 Meiotic recombination SPO11-2 [Micractinium conductrix]